MHEEITLPAYAEAFGIAIKNNGLHPGFFAYSDEDKYFTCQSNKTVPIELIRDCVKSGHSRKAFHPVKYMITLEEVKELFA